jgi:hypothetical protein
MPLILPLSIFIFFNAKTLDYRFDNQAFVVFKHPENDFLQHLSARDFDALGIYPFCLIGA